MTMLKYTSAGFQCFLCVNVSLNWLIRFIWFEYHIFPNRPKSFRGTSIAVMSSYLLFKTSLPNRMNRLHWQVWCQFTGKQTMKSLRKIVEINGRKLSQLTHHIFIVRLWKFQPTLVILSDLRLLYLK